MRRAFLWVAFLMPVASGAVEFTEEPIETNGGQAYEAFQIVAGMDGHYRLGARALGAAPSILGIRRDWNGGTPFFPYGPTGMTEFGSLAAGRGAGINAKTQYMTVYNPVTGVAAMMPFIDNSAFNPTLISSPDGPVVALPNAISVDANGRSYSLFEVQSTTGPHKVILLTYEPGVINQKRTYTLSTDEHVLRVIPNPQGGIIFLTERFTTYLNSIDAAGRRYGPFFSNSCNQLAYVPTDGGLVVAARTVGPDLLMYKAPVNEPLTTFTLMHLPPGYLSSEFSCGVGRSDGTTWWGGSYPSTFGPLIAFILGISNDATPTIFASRRWQAFSPITDIAVAPTGVGMWTAEGQCGMFDTETAADLGFYPAVPVEGLLFRSTIASPGSLATVPPGPFVYPYSRFGAVAYNTLTQQSILVQSSMRGEVRTASVGQAKVLGGVSPTVYVQLFESVDTPSTYSVSTTSGDLTVPNSITFAPGEHTASFKVQTRPVFSERSVELSIGSRPIKVRFQLVPPTPQQITPATQTVSGGVTATARLTLNGKAPGEAFPVSLSCDGPEAKVSPVFWIPEGLVSKSFAIRTTPVTASVTRTITATSAGISRQTSVTILP